MSEQHRIDNKQLVSILKEVLAAMEVKDVNRFRIRAYQNVISSIENLTQPVYDLWENNRLDEIPGVGSTLKQHFDELFTTGKVDEFEVAKRGLPAGMFSLIGIRGIGAKKAYKLASAFDLDDEETALEKVKEAAEENKIRDLDGFAEKSEKDILDAIVDAKMHKREKERLLLSAAEEISGRLITYLSGLECVERVEALGSLRRREATVGDLDIAVSTRDPATTIEYFKEYSEVHEILSSGKKGARVVLTNDVQVDLRVSTPEAYGSMQQYFTGSKIHNVLLRTYALEKGLSLSEYGIKKNNKLHEFSQEEDFYNYLGISYIPPELRQGKNEVDVADRRKIPDLISDSLIKGDIHTHTIASDGIDTLADMVSSAKEKGYEYIGISDHAPSVSTRGYNDVMNIINTQRSYIESINDSDIGIKVLFGYEVNILADSTLSMPDELMSLLDYVIASIHTSFDQDKTTITERLLCAISNPYVNIIGHPTGRLINQRDSYDADWDAVFDAAARYNKILEINAQPTRLDLTDDLVDNAIKKGVKILISTDAHSTHDLDLMSYGVDVARRGWCTEEHIVNTLPLGKFLRILGI